MNPFAIGGGLLGLGASIFGGPKTPSAADLDKLFGAGALAKRQQDIFALLASSPGFRNALSQSNVASQGLSQNIDSNLAKTGLLTGSGVGAIGSALGGAAGGFNRANLIGALSGQSLNAATDLNSLLAGLFQNFQMQKMSRPSPLQNLGGSLLGALGPSFLSKKPIGGNGYGAFGDINNYVDKVFPGI